MDKVLQTFEIDGIKVGIEEAFKSKEKMILSFNANNKRILVDLLEKYTPEGEQSEVFTDKKGIVNIKFSKNFLKEEFLENLPKNILLG